MRGARSLLSVSAGFQFPIFRTRLLGSDESKSGSRTSPLVPEPRRETCQGIADGKLIASDEHWERVAAPSFGRVLHRSDRFPHASNGGCSSCGAEVRDPVCPKCPVGVRVKTLPCRAWGEGGHVTPEWVLQRNLRSARANLLKPEGAESAQSCRMRTQCGHRGRLGHGRTWGTSE